MKEAVSASCVDIVIGNSAFARVAGRARNDALEIVIPIIFNLDPSAFFAVVSVTCVPNVVANRFCKSSIAAEVTVNAPSVLAPRARFQAARGHEPSVREPWHCAATRFPHEQLLLRGF